MLSATIWLSIAALVGVGLANASAGTALPIVVTPALIISLFVLTVAMCAVSAISAIAVVTRVDPVTVFAR